MVLEQIFKLRWIEKQEHSFLLGFIYAIVGIVSAYCVMPNNAGLVSIGFTSILLIPSLNNLLKQEENIELRTKKFSMYGLFKDHFDIIKVYLFVFMGIFFAYFLCVMILNMSASDKIFHSLIDMVGIIGYATPRADTFLEILFNNINVFLVCFFLSFVYGAGSIFFLTINACVWGTILGYIIKQMLVSAAVTGINPMIAHVLTIIPHTITEALGYIIAIIVGGVISKAVLREKPFSRQFNQIVYDALILLFIGFIVVLVAGIFEVYVF